MDKNTQIKDIEGCRKLSHDNVVIAMNTYKLAAASDLVVVTAQKLA